MADILYYSNHCKHSQKLIQYISKHNIVDKISCICIDNRTRDSQNNHIMITLENGSKCHLPPSLQSVPTILRKSKNHTLILGYEQIVSFFQGESKYINHLETRSEILKTNNEPISYGFSSGSFMGYDTNNPIQSMSNLVSVDSSNSINAPDETYKPDKLSSDVTVDKLLEQRNSIKYKI